MACSFPARILAAEMHRVAREADLSQDSVQIMYACAYVKATCDLRLAHEDLTGCQCWYEAVAQYDKEKEPC